MNDWPTALRINAFVRAVETAGGSATVLARGDRESGMILLVAVDRDAPPRLYERERMPGEPGRIVRRAAEATAEHELTDYWQRRRRSDPDLWVVEAMVAAAERLGADTLWAD